MLEDMNGSTFFSALCSLRPLSFPWLPRLNKVPPGAAAALLAERAAHHAEVPAAVVGDVEEVVTDRFAIGTWVR